MDTAGPAAGRGRPSIRDLSPVALLANVAFSHGLLAGIVVAGAWYFAIPSTAFGVAPTPESTGLPAVVAGVGFGIVLWLANEAGARVADAVGFDRDESLRTLLGPESTGGWVLLLGVVLPTIAVGEEVLFRGALIGVPAAGFGLSPWALALVSAVAFALGHGAQGSAGIVVTGLLGLVLAAAFVVSGSLLLVIVAHYLVNALEFVVHEGIDPGRLTAGHNRD
ncbi:MAG: CPBP family intramembrane glutamic endopeptidase [Haloarculaceae archaeon]